MVDNLVTTITPVVSGNTIPPQAPLAVDPVVVASTPNVVTEASPSPLQPVSVVEASVTTPETPKAPETLLGAPEAIVEPIKPVTPEPVKTETVEKTDVKQVEESTKENKEGSQSAEPAPPPTYDTFTLPEGVTLVPERVQEFTSLLTKLETEGKADHATVQKFGQEAVNFYVAEVQKAVTEINSNLQNSWKQQKNEWKETFLKDPEIGGERSQTTVDSALKFVRTHGGTAEQQQEFKSLMETSGLGNHPVMIRLLARAGEAMSEGKPLAAQKPATTSVRSKVQTMYGKLATS